MLHSSGEVPIPEQPMQFLFLRANDLRLLPQGTSLHADSARSMRQRTRVAIATSRLSTTSKAWPPRAEAELDRLLATQD